MWASPRPEGASIRDRHSQNLRSGNRMHRGGDRTRRRHYRHRIDIGRGRHRHRCRCRAEPDHPRRGHPRGEPQLRQRPREVLHRGGVRSDRASGQGLPLRRHQHGHHQYRNDDPAGFGGGLRPLRRPQRRRPATGHRRREDGRLQPRPELRCRLGQLLQPVRPACRTMRDWVVHPELRRARHPLHGVGPDLRSAGLPVVGRPPGLGHRQPGRVLRHQSDHITGRRSPARRPHVGMGVRLGPGDPLGSDQDTGSLVRADRHRRPGAQLDGLHRGQGALCADHLRQAGRQEPELEDLRRSQCPGEHDGSLFSGWVAVGDLPDLLRVPLQRPEEQCRPGQPGSGRCSRRTAAQLLGRHPYRGRKPAQQQLDEHR